MADTQHQHLNSARQLASIRSGSPLCQLLFASHAYLANWQAQAVGHGLNNSIPVERLPRVARFCLLASASPTRWPIMSATIPSEVEVTLEFLRRQSREKVDEGNRLVAQGQALIKDGQQKMRLADELESSVGITRTRVRPPVAINGQPTSSGITIEQIRSYLAHSGGRPNHLAKHFKVS